MLVLVATNVPRVHAAIRVACSVLWFTSRFLASSFALSFVYIYIFLSAIADSIQLVMHIARRDGRHTVNELLRIDGYDHAGETYCPRTLYRRTEVADA